MEKRVTFCIVQLTRIGDNIQTLQAVRELKKTHSNIDFILVGRQQFVNPIKHLLAKDYKKIYTIDLKGMFSKDGTNLNAIKDELKEKINQINTHDIDVTINLSYSKSSGFLTKLVKSNHKLGCYRTENFELEVKGFLSQYLYSNVLENELNSFNLVDLYRQIMGSQSLEEFQTLPRENGEYLIIHPFASLDRKSWKIDKWNSVIQEILKNYSGKICIIGGDEDIESSKVLIKNERIKNLVGKSSFENLEPYFQNAFLFVGHDSVGGHLASYYEVQSLTISFGTVRPSETTPYGNLNYNLSGKIGCYPCLPSTECSLYQCQYNVMPEVIAECITQIHTIGEITHERLIEKLSQSAIEKTRLFVSYLDENIGMVLTDIIPHTSTAKDTMKQIYEVVWSYYLFDIAITKPAPIVANSSVNDLINTKLGFEKLFETIQFGKKYCQFILVELTKKNADSNYVHENLMKISEVSQLIQGIHGGFPLIKPITDFYNVRSSQISATEPINFVNEYYLVIEDFEKLIKGIHELLSNQLKLFEKDSEEVKDGTI